MKLPDGSTLMHDGAPYDPAKAHEYYLRTRKLHPRTKGGVTQPALRPAGSFTVKSGNKTVKLSAQSLQEQKTYAAFRVKIIQNRLKTLNVELQKRVAKAKAGPTAADKTKAAKESQAYRDKHKQELANKRKAAAAKKAPVKKPTTDTVATLRTRITHAKSDLQAAVAKQRELAAAKRNG